MIININVKPNSGEQSIEKNGTGYSVRLKSLPKDGKANNELIKLLKKHFKAKEVRIKTGFTSRKKTAEIIEY
jgi:uncharacterized protein (TIGR00251 family)